MGSISVTDWAVIASGVAAIAWVNWYFFLAERGFATAKPAAGGVQEVAVAVRGGYTPATVRVKAGSRVRLVFDRQETSGCSEEVVFPAFGIRAYLPAHQKTPVEILPASPGTYDFTCGMSMLRGRVVAE